jgi:hypothetical protein
MSDRHLILISRHRFPDVFLLHAVSPVNLIQLSHISVPNLFFSHDIADKLLHSTIHTDNVRSYFMSITLKLLFLSGLGLGLLCSPGPYFMSITLKVLLCFIRVRVRTIVFT